MKIIVIIEHRFNRTAIKNSGSMSKKYRISIGREVVEAGEGETLKVVLDKQGYYFPPTCGGKGRCGHCRIIYHSSPPIPTRREVELFGESSRYRLACLQRVISDCRIEIPPVQEWAGLKHIFELRIKHSQPGFGIAIDLGTTTIALYIFDLSSGELKGQYSLINPQVNIASDVMTRLDFAKDDSGRIKLHQTVISGLRRGVDILLSRSGINRDEISKVFVAGNTAMIHLFLGWGGEGLERAPFRSPLEGRGCIPFKAEDIGLQAGIEAATFPIISGFIGGDTSAAILATKLDDNRGIRLMIDFGTNGEIVLSVEGRLFATSTAAGPAFEGIGMKSGMPAVIGAVEDVTDDGELVVIGGEQVVGFCGSGYIAAVAYLLNKGILDESGLLSKNSDGERVWKAVDDSMYNPCIVQDDIRKFQLAKGAVGAGIEILCKESGVDFSLLDEIIITGSFGNRIKPRSAIRAGLIPNIPVDRINFLDNAAGRGAAYCLTDHSMLERALQLSNIVKVQNLGEHPDFQDSFIRNMSLQTL